MADDIYKSGKAPASSILKSSYINRLSSVFGFRAKKGTPGGQDLPSKIGMEFVRVDLNNDAYRFKNAALGSVFKSEKLTENLEKYFDAYMTETTLSYNDIQDRQRRLNELSFFYYNDNFGYRVVELCAAEATQLDVQDRILTVESPNSNFSAKCYELFARWGITQPRLQQVCHDLELYGESFWSHKIGMNGVESIKPLKVNSIMERLEFNPVHMAEYLAQKNGYLAANKNRQQKIQALVDIIKNKKTMDLDENLADSFDSKLIGYELYDGMMCPPWEITHFRYNAENSEFYPYGRPPLLGCIAPFKQCFSSMMLQGLARQMSFPITMYKVKGAEGMGPDVQFEHVNTVREEYDNLGVAADVAGGEVYTVNTKMWIPDGLIDVDVKESKCDIDFVGDIELYQDRVAIASGVPKAYLDQEFGGFGNSGISLTEQYKPFARHVYTIQSACLEGIGELIRLHFAITGEFDYNTPFILSMRFPAEEMGQEKREARQASLEMAGGVMDLITRALGLEEGEPLPEDVVTDILSKYSFLDPTDIQKWMRLSSFLKPVGGDEDSEGGDDDGGDDFDFGGGDDMGGDNDMGGDDVMEAKKDAKARLRERKARLTELQQKRLREVSKRYKESKEQLFFQFMESNHFTEWQGKDWKPNNTNMGGTVSHSMYVPKIYESSPLNDSIQVLKSIREGGLTKLHEESEAAAVAEKMYEAKMSNLTDDEAEQQRKVQEQIAEDILGGV